MSHVYSHEFCSADLAFHICAMFGAEGNKDFWNDLPKLIEGSEAGAKLFAEVFGCAPDPSTYKVGH